jgi:hypothetical protein
MLAFIGLIIGLVLEAYAVLTYINHPLMANLPAPLRRPGDALWLAGVELLALAAMAGIIGSVINIDLKLARILLGIGGVVLLGLAWPRPNTTTPSA